MESVAFSSSRGGRRQLFKPQLPCAESPTRPASGSACTDRSRGGRPGRCDASSSTVRPRCITISRSHRCVTTARSWLTMMKVRLRSAPQVFEQVQHFGLHRGVERRGRLVEQQDLRLQDQRARDRDALALAARELVRIAEAEARVRARLRRARVRCAFRASPMPWIASGSASSRSTVWRGCSEP